MVEQSQNNLESDRNSAKLFEIAYPGLYRQNAFRVLELTVDATMSDIKRKQTLLKMKDKLGVNSTIKKAGYLSLDPPPKKEDVTRAMHRLQDPEIRLLDELFWFWPHDLNSNDDHGLKLLSENKVNDALKLWTKYETQGSSEKVSTHNLAVLYHALALDLEHKATSGSLSKKQLDVCGRCWKGAYKRWTRLLHDESFWSRLAARIRMLNDPRLTTGSAHRIQNSLPKALLFINARLALKAAERGQTHEVQRHIELMEKSGFEQHLVNETLREAISNIRQRIKMICTSAESKANDNPEQGDKIAKQLLNESKPLLSIIDQLLPEDDVARGSIHDELVLKILQCETFFLNKTNNWKVFLDALSDVVELAVSKSARSRIEQNIDVAQKMMQSTMCFFCERGPGDDKSSIEVAMYGEVQRIPIGYNQIRTTWRHGKIKVPRCSECKSNHDMINGWAGGVGALGFFIGCIGFFINWVAGLICAVVCLCVGAGIGYSIGKSKVPYKIKMTSQQNNFYLIKEQLSKGWQFGDRPAQQ